MGIIEFLRYIGKQIAESLEFLLWAFVLPHGRGAVKDVVFAPGEKRILLVQMDSIGDVLMSTPVVAALRERFPESRIDALVLPGTKEILENDPRVNDVFTLGKRFWRDILVRPGSFARARGRIRMIRERRYDACLDLGGVFDSIVCAMLAGAHTVIGPRKPLKYGIFRTTTAYFYDAAVAVAGKHITEQYLEVAAFLGCAGHPEKEEFFMPEEARKKGESFLNEKGITEGYVVMHPGAKWPPKRWPEEHFSSLIKMFARNGRRTLLVGSVGDSDILEAIKRGSGSPDTAIGSSLGLGELAYVISKADLFVGNDSGPAHIAAAVDTPSVILFGPTDPDSCAPVTDKKAVLHDRIACWPCIMYYRRDRCQRGMNDCLRGISPGKVFEAAAGLMKGADVKK